MKKIYVADKQLYGGIECSQAFNDELDKRLSEAGKSLTDADKADIQANLFIEMQEESFKSLYPGVTVYEYNEQEVYPYIVEINDEDDYTNYEAVHFKAVEDQNQIGSVMHDWKIIHSHDDYEISKLKDDDVKSEIREIDVKGSRQAAEELIDSLPKDDETLEHVKRYANYSSATLQGVKDIISLEGKQREIYCVLFGNTSVSYACGEDGIKDLAQKLSDVGQITQINREITGAERVYSISPHVWENILNDDIKSLFVKDDDLKRIIEGDPTAIKYLNDIPQVTNFPKFDEFDSEKIKEEIMKFAEREAKIQNKDIADVIEGVKQGLDYKEIEAEIIMSKGESLPAETAVSDNEEVPIPHIITEDQYLDNILEKEFNANYADKGFDEAQKREIKTGIESGVDESVYADPKFDAEQMHQIWRGLYHNLDTSVYADPKFDAEQMGAIYRGLEYNAEYPDNPIDISLYSDLKYNGDQMNAIYEALEYNKEYPDRPIDMSIYADPKMEAEQMHEIYIGHMEGLDTSLYACPEMTAEEMRESRELLEEARKEGISENDIKEAMEMPQEQTVTQEQGQDQTTETAISNAEENVEVEEDDLGIE